MSSQPNHDQFNQAYDAVLRDARAGWCLKESALPTLPRTGNLTLCYTAPDTAENGGTQFALIKRDYGPLEHRPNLPHEAVWLTRAIGDYMNVIVWYDGTAIACFGLRYDCEQAHALYRACCADADARFAAYWSDYNSVYAGIGIEETRRDFMIGFMRGMAAELYAIAGVRYGEACRSHPDARAFIEQLAIEVCREFEALSAHLGLEHCSSPEGVHHPRRAAIAHAGQRMAAGVEVSFRSSTQLVAPPAPAHTDAPADQSIRHKVVAAILKWRSRRSAGR
jgi:hypothetical protein